MKNPFYTIISLLFLLPNFGCRNAVKNSANVENKTSQTIPQAPVFDGDSAFKYVQNQVDFGYRIPNTPAHAKTAEYLQNELKRHGAQTTLQEATVYAYDGTALQMKNIIGSFDVDNPNRVLLFAHWDTRPYADNDPDKNNWKKPILGANDGASGVGVLLEIARLMGQKPAPVGVDIIFFDAEDYGQPSFDTGTQKEDTWALGSQYWSKNPHVAGYKARYGILLDMVGARGAVFPRELISQQYANPVVEKIWNAAKKIGYGYYFPDRAGSHITDDHYYVNQYGIPSVDIIHYDNDRGAFVEQWHTLDDTMAFIDKNTLKAVGQTVLEVVYNEK